MDKNWRLLLAILLCSIVCTGWCKKSEEFGWEKIAGVKPESESSTSVLYSALNSEGIVAPCFDRCKRVNCTTFVIDTERSVCYSVKASSDELIPEPNSTTFQQIPIEVPNSCQRDRLWQVERSVGYILIDSGTILLPNAISRSECYKECFKSGCKSIQFRTSKALSLNDTLGTCALLSVERGTRPQGYRASMYRDEYLQVQCHNISRQDYCSYAEYRNVSLPYSDVALSGINSQQCEKRCDLSTDGFICRAYTVHSSAENKSVCLLHSEDTTSLGVSSLVPMANAIYKEREPCLDLKVHCGETTMTIDLITTDPFEGRMYASGFSDACGVQGVNRNVTTLVLPLPKKEDVARANTVIACGLSPAYSVDNDNRTRTIVWATIVVQFNPIIQRLGDQAVRVGCSLDEPEVPQPKNISVHSSLTFLDPNAGVPPIASTVVNTSSEVPVLKMRILDENLEDEFVTQLGQKLILKIEISPADGPYDISAGHLVASSESGSSSILLLNDVGCPTDPTIFPTLQKDPLDNRSLIAGFNAFKFPESQRVVFNVVVRFCLEECIPANCLNGQISYGRKRRGIPTTTDSYVAEVTEISRNSTPDELLLQLSIIVQNRVISADPLMSRETPAPDTILIAGGHTVDGLLCVDAGLSLGLLLFWLIIQLLLIGSCIYAVRQYRRQAIRAEEDKVDILTRHLYGIHGGNFEISRRVRWADRNSPTIT